MHVRGELQLVMVEIPEHLGGVREEVCVPVPSVPSVYVAVHVDAEDVERDAVASVVFQHLTEFAVGIEPVP